MPMNGLILMSLPICRISDKVIGLFRIIILVCKRMDSPRCLYSLMSNEMHESAIGLFWSRVPNSTLFIPSVKFEESLRSCKYAVRELCERMAADLDSCDQRPGTTKTLRTNKLSHLLRVAFFLLQFFAFCEYFPYKFQLTPQ